VEEEVLSVDVVVAETVVDLLSVDVVEAEMVADLLSVQEIESSEEDQRCLMQYVIIVEKTVKFLSNQVAISQYTAVSVLKM
jgi:hypothetical protein